MNNRIVKRNNVTVSGQGKRPMLFAHGFGCDQHMWRHVIPPFEADHKVILFDYVGSGQSDITAYDSERYGTLEGYVQDVLDVIHAMELNDVIFVGHSVSCIVGALAANREPELFSHLIMVGPSPCYLNDPPGYYGGFERQTISELLSLMKKNYIGWAQMMASTIMQNEDRPELTEELEESFCSTDPVIANEFAQVTFLSDNREDLDEIEVPVLIIQCEEDSIAPMNVGQYVHSKIDTSTLEVISANGHCPHLSHPEQTTHIIESYLQQPVQNGDSPC